jgi:pSer/pThr/pTyr-binding forkhead associated (FHA) protein
MSGAITYRLSPDERRLFEGTEKFFQPVLERFGKSGVRLQWSDPELKVTAEETSRGTRFLLVYPLDTDRREVTGRIYLQDEFILAPDDQRILSFLRSFRQNVDHDQTIPFWSELAKFDHPHLKLSEPKEDLQQFLGDLQKLPSPSNADPVLREFQEKILKNLHRPFPANFKAAFDKNWQVFGALEGIGKPLGIRIKRTTEPQSGVAVRREGNRLLLKMVFVLDDEVGTDAISKEYTRIYLTDDFVVDAETHRVLEFRRSYSSTLKLSTTLADALNGFKSKPPPALDSTQLQGLASAVLEGLGFKSKRAPAFDFPQFPGLAGTLSEAVSKQNDSRANLRLKNRRETAAWGLPLLQAAASEKLEKIRKADQAWFLPASGDKATRDPEKRRQALENYFRRVGAAIQGGAGTLDEALRATPAENGYEAFLQSEVLADPSLQKLRTLLAEPNRAFRHEALAGLAREEFMKSSPATTAVIAQALDETTPGRKELLNWIQGQATFAQKIESLLPDLPMGLGAPQTLVSLAVMTSLSSLGKFAFLRGFGYQTRALRWAAEGVAWLIEAPAFLLTEKLLTNSFSGPEESVDVDLRGAYAAFGALRVMGNASSRVRNYLQKNYFNSALPAEAFANRPLASLLFRVGNFRPWVPPLIEGSLSHGGSIAALLLANSLARSLEHRTNSEQGWKADVVDDLLMYGQFVFAGSLARSLRPALRLGWEPYLHAMETAPLQASGTSPLGTWLSSLRRSKTATSEPPKRELQPEAFVTCLSPFEIPNPVPLDPTKTTWRVGRPASRGGDSLDVAVHPMERQVSRLHAVIHKDEATGRYFLQDLSTEGTLVNNRTVYGIVPLYDQDVFQLGRITTPDNDRYEFNNSQAVRPEKGSDLPHFPKNLSPPEQAKAHPPSQEKHFQWAQLEFSDGSQRELLSNKTGFILGSQRITLKGMLRRLLSFSFRNGAIAVPTKLANVPGLDSYHAHIYIDSRGRVILKDLNSAEGVYVHERTSENKVKLVEDPNGEIDPRTEEKAQTEVVERVWDGIPQQLPHLQRIANWTVLYGGERVFLGMGLYFDFWPEILSSPSPSPPGPPQASVSGSIKGRQSYRPPHRIPSASAWGSNKARKS